MSYVPPHLRAGATGAPPPAPIDGGNSAPPARAGYGGGARGGGEDRAPRAGYGGGGGGGGDAPRAGYGANRTPSSTMSSVTLTGGAPQGGAPQGHVQSEGAPKAPLEARNSRWAPEPAGQSYDRGGGGDRGGGYGGSRGGYGGGGPRQNARGFHGDTTPNSRVERELFNDAHAQTTGINFDEYDKIPVEVSGENCPVPIEVYTVETIGEELVSEGSGTRSEQDVMEERTRCVEGAKRRDVGSGRSKGAGHVWSRRGQ